MRIVTILLSLFLANAISAQDIEVKKFEPMAKDQTAAMSPRKDINGVTCGLVKVALKEPGAEFEGSVMGDVQFTGNEYLVYLPNGTKRLGIKHPDYLPTTIVFADYGTKKIASSTTYELKVKTNKKKATDSITFLNHSNNGDFDIPLRWQSKGTQKYIRILDALYDLITSPHVYYLDELGEDLHNDLLYYYLNVFIFNSDKSQLVITSQETTLLSQDMINENRGVVWFVEKNKETASSEYSRGDSFGLHKNLSLYNSFALADWVQSLNWVVSL